MAIVVFFALFIVAFAAAHPEAGEYGKYGDWRKAICEKLNTTIHEEIDTCFQTESKIVRDATKDCINEAVPTAEGSTIAFVDVACKDKSVFMKFDECIVEYEANPTYKKQMEAGPETIACYDAVLEKYGLQELKSFLEEEIGSGHEA